MYGNLEKSFKIFLLKLNNWDIKLPIQLSHQ